MRAWLQLFMREFDIMRKSIIIYSSIVVSLTLIECIIAWLYPSGMMVSIIAPFLFIQPLFILLDIVSSLRHEGKHTPVWIHLPQRGITLISAKIAGNMVIAILFYILLSLVLLLVSSVDLRNGQSDLPQVVSNITIVGFQVDVAMFTANWLPIFIQFIIKSATLAATAIAVYIFVLAFRQKSSKWFILWVLLFINAILIVPSIIPGVPSFESLFTLGTIESWESISGTGNVLLQFNSELALGGIMYSVVFIGVILLLSAWFLDHKAEV